MRSLAAIHTDVQNLANKEKATLLAGFFKTGKGEYGEGDIFLGLTVPEARRIAKKYAHLRLEEIQTLLTSSFHEERLIALLILVHNFQKGNDTEKKEIFEFYLSHTKAINNWDLVDLSAHKIVGEWLVRKRKGIQLLEKLARSKNLWERRIAIISTFAFIAEGIPEPSLEVAEMLLDDTHDLIHKAVGWALREVGKRVSQEKEEEFLRTHYRTMPRTMLRYAIERFPETLRKFYMKVS